MKKLLPPPSGELTGKSYKTIGGLMRGMKVPAKIQHEVGRLLKQGEDHRKKTKGASFGIYAILLLTIFSFALSSFAAAPTPKWRIRLPLSKASVPTDGIAVFVSVGQPLIGPSTNGMLFGDYTISNTVTHVVATNPAGYSVGWSQSTDTLLTTAGATSTILSPNARNTQVSGYSTNGVFTYIFGVTNNTTGARNSRATVQLTILAGFTPDPPIIPPVTTNAIPPLISILTPGSGQSFTGATATVIFTADAVDRQGPVVEVGWDILNLASGVIVHDSTFGAPWAFTNSFAPGTYKATATALNLAALTTVTNVTFQVILPAVIPPVVTMTGPTNGLTLTTPGSLVLQVTATDADGTIQSVQFYQDGTLIGTDVTFPYSLAVSGLAQGTYSYSASATDNGGNRAVSSAVSVIVNPAVIPVMANAGPDQSIQSSGTAQLAGVATGSGISSVAWTQNSGPGTAMFSSTSVTNPTVTFTAVAAGQPSATYSLRLTVVGTSGTAFDDVVVSVSAPPATASTAAKGFEVPVWVNTFPNREVVSLQFVTTNNYTPGSALTMEATVHGLNHEGKMGWQFNNGPVVAVKNSTVTVQGNALGWGGVGGDFHTITFTAPIPANTLPIGTNTIAFWGFSTNAFDAWFQHEPFSYQVLAFNVKDGASYLIPTNTFPVEDPETWTPPLTAPSDIAAGLVLFTNRSTLVNALGQPMIASCADCHFRDGRDLQYFAYHNKTIIARSKSHGLSQVSAERIASYIRSIPSPRIGRPWNSPYQPGPGMDSKPLSHWLAGAGLYAVAPTDADIRGDIFPGGVITNTAIGLHGRMSTREVRTELQLPDWNHWLPQIHPLDAFGSNIVAQTKILAWYDGGTGYTPADAPYVLRRVLQKGNAQSVANAGGFWGAWDSQGSILRSKSGITPAPTSERDSQKLYSTALLLMVKTAELMTEYEIEEIVPQQLLKPDPDPRMWRTALAFETSPNILGLNPSHAGIAQNTPRDHYYFTMAWYAVQLAVNGGSRSYIGLDYQHAQRSLDWGYLWNFLTSWPQYTGRGNTFMFLEYFVKGLQSLDTGRGPEYWGKAGWNPHSQYGIFWLFSNSKPSFANVSVADRTKIYDAWLRNWIAGNKLYPVASNWYRIDAATPWVPPMASASWIPPRQNPDGTDFWANGVWNTFGTGANTQNGSGVDKAIQNEIITFMKTIVPLADWESRRPPP